MTETVAEPRTRWRNWSRTLEVRPAALARPADTDELADAVLGARERGLRVKAVGAGHSFSAIAETDGLLVDPSRMTGILGVDVARSRARFRAGTRLWEVPELLRPYRLAMTNLGDIDRQTLAGAISTGTHGTGARFGGIASHVTGLTLVLADGTILTARVDGENADLLPGLRVGLGALGLIAEVELQCEPAFVLEATERPEPWDAVLHDFPARAAAVDHLEFFWWPHTDTVMTKENVRRPWGTPVSPPGRVSAFLEDRLLETGALGLACGVGALVPSLTPRLNRLATQLYGDRSFSDLSHRVFAKRRDVRFRETEWAVPIDALPDALRELRALVEREGWRISFPVEVRTAAADDAWLSTAHERDSGYIAVHRWWRDRNEPYLRAAGELLAGLGGRPHWGKLHELDADALAGRYPRFGEFTALRDRLDPDRALGNPHLARILGP